MNSRVLDIGTSFWTLLCERAGLSPDDEFLSDERGRMLTFGQYRDRAEWAAAGLSELGVDPDHVVSWQLPTTLEAAVLLAALSRLGVRQNPIIPILRRAEVSLITRQVDARWFLAPGTLRGFDHVAMARDACPPTCAVLDTSEWTGDLAIPVGDPSRLGPAVDPGDSVRWFFYSSGTTAVAKGAKHSDASAMASSNGQIACLELQRNDLFALPFPITHIGGIMLLTGYLRVGARIWMIEAFDPVATPVAMAERGVTVFGTATPFFHAYLAAQRRHGDEPLFPAMRQLQAGGAPITPELNADCVRVFGTPIYNQWGLTEFPAATSLAVGDPPGAFEGTVGRMAPGAEIRVLALDGASVVAGGEGELCVRGPQRCLGYVDSALDAGAFDQDGWFRTGDLGTVDQQGFVRITGRLKDIIIRNAENLSALEIEAVLAEHPAVADVAVIGVPDERTGERACAVVVLAENAMAPTLADLAEHCRAAGLAIQKTPEQLHVVDSLPRNPMEKVLKHELRAALVAPET